MADVGSGQEMMQEDGEKRILDLPKKGAAGPDGGGAW